MSDYKNITYYAEGSLKETRKIHFPGGESGATIGKGFDFKFKTKNEIEYFFKSISLSSQIIKELKKLAKLSASQAKRIIDKSPLLKTLVLTDKQIIELFKKTYAVYKNRAKDLTKHKGNMNKYGDPAWETMPSKLKELIIDLTYRGDYSSFKGVKRIPQIQKFIVKRDYQGLCEFYNNDKNRGIVPLNRWMRRKKLVIELWQDLSKGSKSK